VSGGFLMIPGDGLCDFLWALPTLSKSVIHFWGGSTHTVVSVTPDGRMIIRMAKGCYCLTWSSKPWCRSEPGILYFPKVFFSLATVKGSVCEQKNPHTDLNRDKT
jgi:hypothetical protein